MNQTELQQLISDFLLSKKIYYYQDENLNNLLKKIDSLNLEDEDYLFLNSIDETNDYILRLIKVKVLLSLGEFEEAKKIISNFEDYFIKTRNFRRIEQLKKVLSNFQWLFDEERIDRKKINTPQDYIENPKYFITNEDDFSNFIKSKSLLSELEFIKAFVEISPSFRLTNKTYKEFKELAISGGSRLFLELLFFIESVKPEYKIEQQDKLYISKYYSEPEEVFEQTNVVEEYIPSVRVSDAKERSEIVNKIIDLKELINQKSISRDELLNCFYELSDCYMKLGRDSIAYVLLKQVQIENRNFRRVSERLRYFEGN